MSVAAFPDEDLGVARVQEDFKLAEQLQGRFRDYLLHELGRSPVTVRLYIRVLEMLCAHNSVLPQDLIVDDVRTFVRENGSRDLKRLAVAAAKSWHRWGVLEGLWEPNGIPSLPAPRGRRNQPAPALSVKMARRLLDACQTPREYRIVYPGLLAGCRIGESARLTEDSFDLEDDCLHILGKGSKWRDVPLHPELRAARDEILSPDPPDPQKRWGRITADTLEHANRVMRKRVGIHFVPHQLRRTFAQRLYDDEVPFEIVGDLLGHSGTVTNLYVRVSWRRKVEAVRRLSYRHEIRSDRAAERRGDGAV